MLVFIKASLKSLFMFIFMYELNKLTGGYIPVLDLIVHSIFITYVLDTLHQIAGDYNGRG